jgi:hypothetical protein
MNRNFAPDGGFLVDRLPTRALGRAPRRTNALIKKGGDDGGDDGLRFHRLWDTMCQEFWDTC